MQMLTVAGKLNWRGWLLGLLGATISGGASAVTAGFSVSVIDPKDWSPLQGGAGHLLELMGLCFIISAILSLMKYLQLHPVPESES